VKRKYRERKKNNIVRQWEEKQIKEKVGPSHEIA